MNKRVSKFLMAGVAGLARAASTSAALADAKGKKVLMVQSFAVHPYVAGIIKSFKAKAET